MHGRYEDYYEPAVLVGPYTTVEGYKYYYNKSRKAMIYVGTDGYIGKCDSHERWGYKVGDFYMWPKRFRYEVDRESYNKASGSDTVEPTKSNAVVAVSKPRAYSGEVSTLNTVKGLAVKGYYDGTLKELASRAGVSDTTVKNHLDTLQIQGHLIYKTVPGRGVQIIVY